MPRKPKPKNALSAGQRVALQEQQRRDTQVSADVENDKSDGAIARKSAPVAENIVRTVTPKEKPQVATVRVDLSLSGDNLPMLDGMCNGPVSQGADISGLFRKMGTPWVRFSKTDGARSGYVVDISKIFPDMNADERDPKSYHFRETDAYIHAAANAGCSIIYRLGESFEASTPDRLLTLYDDADRLAIICVNIIKHYNDYFCSGSALGIRYFEIFSDVDIPSVREKNTDERIFSTYARIANAIKLYDSSLKVGGMGFSSCSSFCREFIRYCSRKRVPLDFLSVSAYYSSPEDMGEELSKYVHMLKNSPYSNAEMIVGEWGYIPKLDGLSHPAHIMHGTDASVAEVRRRLFDARADVRGAAYAAAGLIKMLEYPDISGAFYFDAQPLVSNWCAVCDSFGLPCKPSYAFETYAKLRRTGKSALCRCDRDDKYAHAGVYAAASANEREAYIMMACFDACPSIDLRLDNIPESFYTAEIYMLDGVKDMSLCDSVQLSGMKKRLVLSTGAYGIVLIKVY